ncbi:MAG: hypothetical protein A2675_03475 [Candidatus Yonathbacteria bacterium RIFCSPHIGHO2_01_FULL_51_10]|uniref:Uncharacterized protein n=1 Tax=Candidatus Yonathbacteria bacterium RIFCSPHIGHO2_01_FULL_51_10 TaxID=1802723 RepID=A0A1G2S8Q5_9BACT|nr:MAG: hypothetical protein A2675_03475 [Candidatus Yonathbacteria bacterium RIFCSPHIGHO2_01_FULL_51_10]
MIALQDGRFPETRKFCAWFRNQEREEGGVKFFSVRVDYGPFERNELIGSITVGFLEKITSGDKDFCEMFCTTQKERVELERRMYALNTILVDRFPQTKRLCRLFRLLARKRGLTSGPGMNMIDLYKWEFVVNTGIIWEAMTPEQIAEREEISRIGCQCLLIGELVDCGLVPVHTSLPEPTGLADPRILEMLASAYREELTP